MWAGGQTAEPLSQDMPFDLFGESCPTSRTQLAAAAQSHGSMVADCYVELYQLQDAIGDGKATAALLAELDGGYGFNEVSVTFARLMLRLVIIEQRVQRKLMNELEHQIHTAHVELDVCRKAKDAIVLPSGWTIDQAADKLAMHERRIQYTGTPTGHNIPRRMRTQQTIPPSPRTAAITAG